MADEALIIEGDNCCDYWEWEDLCDGISEEMEMCLDFIPDRDSHGHRYYLGGYWYVEAKNFGWRNLDGHKTFFTDDGEALLQEILPSTDCAFWLFKVHGN